MKYLDNFFQPDGWVESSFTARDGKHIRYGHVAAVGASKGTVVMTTGYADFIESFYETVHAYRDRGYDVWIMDWAGQGGSAKRRDAGGSATPVASHVAHLHDFVHTVVKADNQKPLLMSTHSLGGQIGLQYLSIYPDDFTAAVMAAPLVDFRLRGITRAVLRGIFHAASVLGLSDATIKGGRRGIQQQAINERKKIRREDPIRMDLHKTFFLMNKELSAEDPSIGLIDSLFEATAKLNEETVLKNIKIPVLFGVAGEDHVVDNDSIRRAAQLMPQASLVDVPGATHGLWQERDRYRNAWWAHVDSFISKVPFIPKTPANDVQKPPPKAASPKPGVPKHMQKGR